MDCDDAAAQCREMLAEDPALTDLRGELMERRTRLEKAKEVFNRNGMN